MSILTIKNISHRREGSLSPVETIKNVSGLYPLSVPLQVMRKLKSSDNEEIRCVFSRCEQGYVLVDIDINDSYGIAIDIGTTNIVATIYNSEAHSLILEKKIENPQISLGSDILTRVHNAMTGMADELHSLLIEGINRLINEMCNEIGISHRDIHGAVVAGNTIMTHFFLGLDTSGIPVHPYRPVVMSPGFVRADEVGLKINTNAYAYVFPCAGSYVGGDIISGLISSGMVESDEVCVFIDVGTNTEVVVGCREWMLAGAGAAGPALEEGIASVGKRAGSGIIYDLEITDKGTRCMTFDGESARGVCGSGMVSLIYEMYKNGIIDSNGILDRNKKGVCMLDGELCYVFSCNSGETFTVRQREIENFLRSKAAMITLLLVLLRSVGLGFSDVHRVYVAGALGNGIDIKKASGIGMLPQWKSEKIIPLGNASLRGASLLLRDSSLLEKVTEITNLITYRHMHDDPEFMKEFRGATFIPHTDPDLLKVS